MTSRYEVAQELDHHLYPARRFVADPVAALPATPTAGRVVFLIADGTTYWADGAAWHAMGGSAGAPKDGYVAFTFASGSPLTLIVLSAGDVIEFVQVIVETTFDDAATTLKVGTVATPDLVLGTAEIAPGVVGQSRSDVAHEIAGAEFLKLTISPGGSTQGAGHVLFRVRAA